jgi:hypothetical protein
MLPTASPRPLVSEILCFLFGQFEQPGSIAHIRFGSPKFDWVGRMCSIWTVHKFDFRMFKMTEMFMETLREL